MRPAALKLLLITIRTGLALGGAELVLRARNPFGFRMRGSTLVLPANKVYDIKADPRSRGDREDPLWGADCPREGRLRPSRGS